MDSVTTTPMIAAAAAFLNSSGCMPRCLCGCHWLACTRWYARHAQCGNDDGGLGGPGSGRCNHLRRSCDSRRRPGLGLVQAGGTVLRSPGIELAWSLLSYAARHHWRVALIGAAPAVMESLRQILPAKHPGLDLVMTVDGYQSAERWPGLESELLKLKPDLVLVALGVPRQETWSARLSEDASGLWMGVGGSFDVWAGTKTRAPAWMGRLQIEWLYRLIQEPSRWRRMLCPGFVLKF